MSLQGGRRNRMGSFRVEKTISHCKNFETFLQGGMEENSPGLYKRIQTLKTHP